MLNAFDYYFLIHFIPPFFNTLWRSHDDDLLYLPLKLLPIPSSVKYEKNIGEYYIFLSETVETPKNFKMFDIGYR